MRLGFYYVLSVPYVAGFACFSGPMVGGFRLTGWVFAVMLATAPLVFVLDRTPSRFPLWVWVPWLLIVILSLTWADHLNLDSLQDVCTIITPFVISPIASKSLKTPNDLKILLKSFDHCLSILLAGLILHLASGVGIVARPMAVTAAIVGCVYLSQVRERSLGAVLGWSMCLLIAALTGSRMCSFVILLEWLIIPRYRRQTARLLVACAVSALAVGLFYTPWFQDRFFLGEQGTLGDVSRGEFFSSGRFEAWPELWEEVGRRPLLGAGAHASAGIVNRVWEDMSHPHNDYLRILLDQGSVGLSLFLMGVLGQLVSLRSQRITGSNEATVVQSAACMGILVLLVTATTDNPIVYGVWFMHPLFVLIGACYGSNEVSSKAKNRNRPSM